MIYRSVSVLIVIVCRLSRLSRERNSVSDCAFSHQDPTARHPFRSARKTQPRIQFSSPVRFLGGPGMLRSTSLASEDFLRMTSLSFSAVCMRRTLNWFLGGRQSRSRGGGGAAFKRPHGSTHFGKDQRRNETNKKKRKKKQNPNEALPGKQKLKKMSNQSSFWFGVTLKGVADVTGCFHSHTSVPHGHQQHAATRVGMKCEWTEGG